MLILSIDIGIKNLSHCLFRVEDTFTLLHWDLVDLTNNNLQTCNAVTKKGRVCGKCAKYRKSNHQYCLTHAKSSPFSLPMGAFKNISSSKKEHIRDLCTTYSISFDPDDTKLLLMNKIKEYQQTIELIPIQKSNAKVCNFIDLGKTLNEKYTTIF